MNTSPIILCADDYGYRPGVSAAIRRLAEAGRISASSALVTFADWSAAAEHVSALRRHIDVGLHVNLTEGAALSPVTSLAPEGVFLGLTHLLRAAFSGRIDTVGVKNEIIRQFQAFRRSTGHEPDYVDGHQHAHALPMVRTALFEALAEQGWTGPIRDPSDRLMSIVNRRVAVPKALLISALSSGFGVAARQRGFQTNDSFSGVYDFRTDFSFAQLLTRFAAYPAASHLVMVHPGDREPEDTLDPIAPARAHEADALGRMTGLSLRRFRGTF
jgi:predicted glycoside hydrolase/deacetylase ChbG (UPF0249 family)